MERDAATQLDSAKRSREEREVDAVCHGAVSSIARMQVI
jgi:hypothetical protein